MVDIVLPGREKSHYNLPSPEYVLAIAAWQNRLLSIATTQKHSRDDQFEKFGGGEYPGSLSHF
jgi:hypothetical protein